jgi:hypothetical protein
VTFRRYPSNEQHFLDIFAHQNYSYFETVTQVIISLEVQGENLWTSKSALRAKTLCIWRASFTAA